ncbi:MAG: hypothetical protein KGL39_14180 [Patescibacteria group bacterium]|nr:hypothetical protein [Patescibacteria group bacterium]
MARFGFIGGSYQSQSPYADMESTMNWYPETMESQGAKSAMTLYPTPGFTAFATLGADLARAMIAINGRAFAVGNSALWEINSNGTVTNRGTVNTSGAVKIVTGNFYLFITSNNHAYWFKLADNTFGEVTASLAQSNPTLAFFVDGYYGVVFSGTNEFQISSLEDPTTWNGVDVAQISVFPDNIVGTLVDHRVLWIWGNNHAQAYYNSGDPSFPLNVIPGGFMEQGLDSPTCQVRMDNSVFWIGADERGESVAWRANGYTPVRVSNHGIETQWRTYSAKTSDAVGWTYQESGHTFWVLYFPSGNATWVYDAATNLWHQRGFWNGTSNDAWVPNHHCYAFGKHLVGSRGGANIQQLSAAAYTDAGTTIVRQRIAPVVATEEDWLFHRQLTVDAEMNNASTGNGPALNLQWSDDAGATWSNTNSVYLGSAATPQVRAVYRRLGRSRRRVYKISVSDSTPVRLIDAYLLADPGFQSVPRLTKYYGQMS